MSASHIKTSEFKAHCSQVLEDVAGGKGSVVITRHGRPVAKLVPIEDDHPPSVFGFAKGMIAVRGDIVAPVGEAWDAEG